MDFAMDIHKLNLVKLVGKVMDKIMEYQIFFAKVYRKIKAKCLSQKLYFNAKIAKPPLALPGPLPINVRMSKLQSKFSDIMM